MPEDIRPDQMFPLLLEADPSFAPVWRAFVEEWKDDSGGLPLTIAIDDFAKHLIHKLETGETSRFKQVFAVIERMHSSTDGFVRNEVIGISEGILSTQHYERFHPYDFEPWLQPETKRAWLVNNRGYYGREWPTDR